MPEGDTVWLAAHTMHEALSGEELLEMDVRVPRWATLDLSGHRILEVVPRGKHMLIRIDSGHTIHTHFLMDGSWHLYRPGARWNGGPTHEVRMILRTEPWEAVGYRLHLIEVVPTAQEERVVGHLGPDLLGPWQEPDLQESIRRLARDPTRPIGAALLDQRNVAGLGLIYVTETLFVSRITPWLSVGEVPDLAAVLQTGHRLMDRNKGHWSQATTGEIARGREHYVYLRAGRPCRRCGTRIRYGRQDAQPHERDAYWCPTCQIGPGPTQGSPAAGRQ